MQKKININVTEKIIGIGNMINDNNNSAVNQIVVMLKNHGKLYVSYGYPICYNRGDIVYLSPKWDSSKTTRKHLYIFMRDELRWNVNQKKDVDMLIKESNVLVLVDNISFE